MRASFEESLLIVHKEISLSSEDRESYNKDAEDIRNHLMNELKKTSAEFRAVFGGLSLTGSYLDNLKIDLPDEFDMHLILNLPCRLSVAKNWGEGNCIFLKVSSIDGWVPDIVSMNKISRRELQRWIRDLLLEVITEEGMRVRFPDGRRYEINYPKNRRGYAVAHTVIAKELQGIGKEISFDFVPAFQFAPSEWPLDNRKCENRDWFAVPYGRKIFDRNANEFAFRVCAPHWERSVLHDKKNLKSSLRLMKALRDAAGLKALTSYMLKSVYLKEIELRSSGFWEKPIGDILLQMLACLESALRKKELLFYLDEDVNHFDHFSKRVTEEYANELNAVRNKLQSLKAQGSVDVKAVKKIFGC